MSDNKFATKEVQYIKATFTGTSNTEYTKGLVYRLKLLKYKGMSICKVTNEGYVEYESLSAFLRNWTNINHI